MFISKLCDILKLNKDVFMIGLSYWIISPIENWVICLLLQIFPKSELNTCCFVQGQTHKVEFDYKLIMILFKIVKSQERGAGFALS